MLEMLDKYFDIETEVSLDPNSQQKFWDWENMKPWYDDEGNPDV
jgi:uncharacterized membrane protein